jgi:hypothetical protein
MLWRTARKIEKPNPQSDKMLILAQPSKGPAFKIEKTNQAAHNKPCVIW